MGARRNTIQRQVILASLQRLNIHATAEQVYDDIIRTHPSISKATVYRNLGQMVEAGELLNIGSFYGAVHYDHNCHRHYHFMCERCRQVFDVEDTLPDLPARLAALEHFTVTGYNLTFSGTCPDCDT